MAGLLIAPSEPPLIKSLGTSSSTPERYGADILWAETAVHGLIGIQRKEFTDLINSVADGRLSKEVQQLKACHLSILIVEGVPHWTADGILVHKWARWTRQQHNSLLRSVQIRGIVVEYTNNTADTVALVESIVHWAKKADHTSLDRRPKPSPDEWGKISDKGWGLHLLQSVPGFGPKQAELVWEHFGRAPVGLTVTRDELLEIKGLGPKRVDALMKAFGGAAI